MDFPKESTCNAGDTGDVRDMGSFPRLGRSPGEGKGNLLQYSCLGNSIDRGTWWTSVHEVAELGVTEHAHTHIHTHAHDTAKYSRI